MARVRAEVGLRKSHQDRKIRPPAGERTNRRARVLTRKPPTPKPEPPNAEPRRPAELAGAAGTGEPEAGAGLRASPAAEVLESDEYASARMLANSRV